MLLGNGAALEGQHTLGQLALSVRPTSERCCFGLFGLFLAFVFLQFCSGDSLKSGQRHLLGFSRL